VPVASVLVVGEHPLVRAGVAALLRAEPEVAVAGSGALDEAPSLLGALSPEVLCWDAGGEEASAEALVAAAGEVPVLALLGPLEQAGALLRGGVRSLLARNTAPQALAAALLATARGLAVLEPSFAATWLRAPARRGVEGGCDALTAREQEVLALLAEGLGNKAIAARLDISDHTAKFHVNAILAKLGAASRAEAIVLAARRGLVVL
jgi:DNA-binding NarL/FixJ family response regulator